MSLTEVIAMFQERAKQSLEYGCKEYADIDTQVANWLIELRQLKEGVIDDGQTDDSTYELHKSEYK